MIAFVLDLGVSDVCDGWPGISPYVLTQAAHATIGAGLAVVPRWIASGVFGGWTVKELAADFATCPTVAVAIDSGADLAIAALGYALTTYCITNRATAAPRPSGPI